MKYLILSFILIGSSLVAMEKNEPAAVDKAVNDVTLSSFHGAVAGYVVATSSTAAICTAALVSIPATPVMPFVLAGAAIGATGAGAYHGGKAVYNWYTKPALPQQ